jgi:hypothetical protein
MSFTSRRHSSNHTRSRRFKGKFSQGHDPAALPAGKTRYPLYRMLGLVWSGKYRPPTEVRSRDRLARSESPYRLSYTDRSSLKAGTLLSFGQRIGAPSAFRSSVRTKERSMNPLLTHAFRFWTYSQISSTLQTRKNTNWYTFVSKVYVT